MKSFIRWASEVSGNNDPTIRDMARVTEGANRVDGINVYHATVPGSFREVADRLFPTLRERGRDFDRQVGERCATSCLGVATDCPTPITLLHIEGPSATTTYSTESKSSRRRALTRRRYLTAQIARVLAPTVGSLRARRKALGRVS